MLKALYRFFRSMKLAIVLIVYLIGLTMVIGIQGPEVGVAWVIIPVMLFAVNLTVCAVARVVGRLKSGSYFHRFGWLATGPDLVHLSILLFLVGGLLSHYGRIDGAVTLKPGELVNLNSTYLIRLEDFHISYYNDGRPKQYISSIQVLKGTSEEGEFELVDRSDVLVNKPYSMGRLKIYQRSYQENEGASVLQAVYDPGYPAIIAGIIFFLLGLSFILADKIRRGVI